MARLSVRRGVLAFAVGCAVIVVAYVLTVVPLWLLRGVDDNGPLSFHRPATTRALQGAIPPGQALHICYPHQDKSHHYVLVGGFLDERPYYACYEVENSSGKVFDARVIDGQGARVSSTNLLKRSGAWRWIGTVKTKGELVLGGAAIVGLLVLCWAYYRRLRPGAPVRDIPWYEGGPALVLWVLLFPVGWIVLAVDKRVSRARKGRAAMQVALVFAAVLFVSLLVGGDYGDALSIAATGFILLALLYGVVAGREWVAPVGFGAPEDLLPESGPAAAPVSSTSVSQPTTGSELFDVEPPSTLPTFADIGGMDDLKKELKETIGLMLAFTGEAETYGISWNGILLHGPPGVGKTFLARAVAGEFGMNLIQVSAGELASSLRGESARNVEEVFRCAARNVPCLLFLDEFDAVAESRDDWPDQESRRAVGQLLRSLEEYRPVHELVVMAATNHLDDLDRAVIRPGRFDRHIRVDLPDAEARKSIIATCLRKRPLPASLDLDELARRSAGLTPAAIAHAVQVAALSAFKEAADTGTMVQLTQDSLEEALKHPGGSDRPTVEEWTWDSLVLPDKIKDELQELQAVIEDPDAAQALGVEPPTGVLLTGPPGTGKTTVAKVLAAQAKCSFYPVSAADIISKWLGESERNVQRLFRRARENRPSVIFIDEIDSIGGRRGGWRGHDRHLNELLEEMDGVSGQGGILVLAATNRPDELDPALLRGGRLSRTILIPLPDQAGREALLRLFTHKMPLLGVNLAQLARHTDGYSGADLRALCQQAALHGLVRARKRNRRPTSVNKGDFDEALTAFREGAAAREA